MTNSICFGTAFYHAVGDAPNLKNSTDKFDKYYKCMIVLFASIRRFYKTEKCYIFVDKKLPEGYNQFLESLSIEQKIIEKNSINYVNSFDNNFPGCLFTLDVISYFDKNMNINNDLHLLLLDSDIVINKSLDNIFNQLLSNKFSTGICIDYPIDKQTNGFSRNDLSSIFELYIERTVKSTNFKYFGGEIYFIHSSHSKLISSEIHSLINYLLNNNTLAKKSFTEEHIMSIIFNKLNENIFIYPKLIKRIWTTDTHHNINGDENQYSLFHLPAEKDLFFDDVFTKLSQSIDCLNRLNKDEYEELILLPINKRIKPNFQRKLTIFTKKILKYLQGKLQ